MSEVRIRKAGRAGRITLARPGALNALTYEMCRAIDAALVDWADDDAVALVAIDAEGERAFCAGGDIVEMYATGTRGDYGYGRRFWRDEYRMNRRIAAYPKPVASFLQGFTMGGGVGLGCHASHRVVGESAKIAMPECTIGLVPDVGGSLLLARAPGRLGEYLGLTGTRMRTGDAIYAGFADHVVPEARWPDLIAALERDGDAGAVDAAAEAPPHSDLAEAQAEIDALFSARDMAELTGRLRHAGTPRARDALEALGRNSPLSTACTLALVRRVREAGEMEAALEHEYRFTFRAMEHGDFLEGIRARIIDKDNAPRWRHAAPVSVAAAEVERMLAPLGPDALSFA